MTPKQINEKILGIIPESRPLFESVTSWQDGIETGGSLTVEDVVMVLLREALEHKNSRLISKCSQFIEWLAENMEDDYASSILVTSIFEPIHYASDRLSLESALGPCARNKYNSIKWPY